MLLGGVEAEFTFQYISSNNLQVDSLTDLQTLFKSTNEQVGAWGNCDLTLSSAGSVQAVSKDTIYYITAGSDPSIRTKTWAQLMNKKFTEFTDNVETI
nr:MAG TPA: hypothetical protein [Caudoviricetes sp.]